jgi:hypothetical protein
MIWNLCRFFLGINKKCSFFDYISKKEQKVVDPEGVEPSSDSNAQRNSFTGLVAFSKTTKFGAFLFWDDLMLSQCTLRYEPNFRFGLKEDQTPPVPFCSRVSTTRWLSCYCKLYLFNHRDNFRSSID